MKIYALFGLFALPFAPCLSAQTLPVCDSMSLAYSVVETHFEASDMFLWGDSMMTLRIINNSTDTFYAYPMAKVWNETALPAGMSPYSDGWNVFASAWNPGDTLDARLYFTVNQPIPADYMVTFQVYLKNLEPALPDNQDSCKFLSPFQINLNPTPSGLNTLQQNSLRLYPNPNSGRFVLEYPGNNTNKILIYNALGAMLMEQNVSGERIELQLDLPPGLYSLIALTTDGQTAVQKLYIE